MESRRETASWISIPNITTLRITCMTDVIIVDPPGDPNIMKGEPFLRTIVGVMELSGLLFDFIAFASLPISP